MITFKQFIRENEPKDDLDDERPATVAALLKGPCKNYLRQSQGNGVLFRGMDNYGELYGFLDIPVTGINGEDTGKKLKYYKKVVRKDRKPMSTTLGVHKIIDNWFEEEMGMKARSEAMFCMVNPAVYMLQVTPHAGHPLSFLLENLSTAGHQK